MSAGELYPEAASAVFPEASGPAQTGLPVMPPEILWI